MDAQNHIGSYVENGSMICGLRVGDIVRHFKRELVDHTDNTIYLYRIIAFAEHTETKEKLVVYQALYRDEDQGVDFGVYCRPYDMFMSKVDKAKYPDVKQEYRFERL